MPREGGAATQQALQSIMCPLVSVHRWLCREQERGQQTWQAETGTAPKTQQGDQRLPGEPEEQALYVDPPAWEFGLPPPAWLCGGRWEEGPCSLAMPLGRGV